MRNVTRTIGAWGVVVAAVAACAGGGGGGASGEGRAVPAANPWVVSPVQAWGKLHACGTHICSKDDQPVQLRGMSLFWSNTGWGAEAFYDAAVVNNLADQWNATVVRAAVGAQGSGSYLSSPTDNLNRAKKVIDAAIAKGMYVIVDWHSHGDGASDLSQMTAQAKSFFGELAAAYRDAPNVIWETFNEPPGASYGWPALKAYHEAVIAEIRARGSTNLVVVGSPNWSQDVDVASAAPVSDSAANVAYTLHFYAHTHGAALRAKAEAALSRGVALFVTEWGTCDASGNGGLDPAATAIWLAWLDEHQLSSANWSMNAKAETASALLSTSTGPWSAGQLSDSGWLVLPYVHRGYAYDLQVTRAGAGTGTVTSTPAGIDCGETCAVDFTAATAVTLTATPAAGQVFAGWSGGCTGAAACVLTMSEARSVTATFAAAP